jgi:hypothetical protein
VRDTKRRKVKHLCIFFPSTTQDLVSTLVVPNWCHCTELWTSSTSTAALCFFRD